MFVLHDVQILCICKILQLKNTVTEQQFQILDSEGPPKLHVNLSVQ